LFGNNVSVVFEDVDFSDFTTDETVTWTFYLYGATSENLGTRFDDIKLTGRVSDSDSGDDVSRFFRIELITASSF
jgi:hypothetical protein